MAVISAGSTMALTAEPRRIAANSPTASDVAPDRPRAPIVAAADSTGAAGTQMAPSGFHGKPVNRNARAYIGTLYPVSDIEAEAVAVAFLGKHFGKMLPHALWSAQNSVYGEGSDRRPYVASGVYPQRLRSTAEDVPRRIISKLWNGLRYWKKRAAEVGEDEPERKKDLNEVANYYAREFPAFRERWFRQPAIHDR